MIGDAVPDTDKEVAMIKGVLGALLAVALLAGCGKKAASQPQAQADSTAPAAAMAVPDAAVQASLDDVQKKLQAQQYEAAVGSLVALNGLPKTDKQRNEYTQQLRSANDVLLQKASQGDQQALQSQLILGRMLKGR
jgi:uncharacterized lipoprotein YajG